jgi:hypothetical protein
LCEKPNKIKKIVPLPHGKGTINKFINYSLFSPTGDGAKIELFI